MMKSIFIPDESFQNKQEIHNIFLMNEVDSLLDDIDEKIEVWIIGNNDTEFFDNQTKPLLKEEIILDPADGLPVSEHRGLQHIAVINYNGDDTEQITREYTFGNTDYAIYDFVVIVLSLLKTKFPKKKPNELTGNIDKKYMFPTQTII